METGPKPSHPHCEFVERAFATWPPDAALQSAFSAWLSTEGAAGFAARTAACIPGETLLCWALARRHRWAIVRFEREYLNQVAPALHKLRVSADVVQEVQQGVRMKLLLPDQSGALPILRYAFVGNVAGLVRVTAVRQAIDLFRARPPATEELIAANMLTAEADPKLQLLKQRHASDFLRALRSAFAALPSEQRAILRLHLAGHASIDEFAKLLGIHRATAARRLEAAREQLAQDMRARLQQALRLTSSELESMLRFVRSDVTRQFDALCRE